MCFLKCPHSSCDQSRSPLAVHASRRTKEIISHTPTQSGPEFLRHQTCDPCRVQDAQLPREEIYFLASEEWAYLEDFFFLLWIRVDFAQDASLVRSPSCACVVVAEATAICRPRQNAQIWDAAHYPAAERKPEKHALFFLFLFLFLVYISFLHSCFSFCFDAHHTPRHWAGCDIWRMRGSLFTKAEIK